MRDFVAGARGVLLAEAGLESSRTGRRVELPVVAIESTTDVSGARLDAASELPAVNR